MNLDRVPSAFSVSLPCLIVLNICFLNLSRVDIHGILLWQGGYNLDGDPITVVSSLSNVSTMNRNASLSISGLIS